MEVNEILDNWISQSRKGLLDFLILLCLKRREYYGYELIKEIKNLTQIDLSEGTIYPLLNRLKKEDLISSLWVDMGSGIPRKYYKISEKGLTALTGMKQSWNEINLSLQKLMEIV